ncbi:MAG: ABC transporter ATP-binding protein [Actinomycetota bacterium]
MSAESGAGAASLDAAPAVALRGITKRYGSVVACDAVDLDLHRGRVHGVLGENGAGKSTLMKILIGLVLPDAGSIELDGERVDIHDPLAAADHGIAMVHQHFSLVEALTVWENVALGDVGRLDPRAVRDRVGDISQHYGLDVEPDATVADLPAGLRQRVEIIKCLRRDPGIIIFDEPTSVLTPAESEQLFTSLREVIASEGRAVALVSHKLDEILGATDDVMIMRRGEVVARMPIAEADAPTLAAAMVGREVSLRSERVALGIVEVDPEPAASVDEAAAEPVLAIRDVVSHSSDGRVLLDRLSLEVGAGEILGVAGVEGNGQRALGDLLSSLLPVESGHVLVDAASIACGRAGAMAAAGVAVVPEDRHDSGCVLDMTVAENLFLGDFTSVARAGLIDGRAMRGRAEELIDRFGISCGGPDAPMWSLSGGNQQRVVLARELSQDPVVLVAAQPTRGLDVGAIEYMTEQIRQVAAEGVAVLLISSELEEILDLSHRIAVLHRGSVIGEMPRADADLDRLGLLMGGQAA